MNFPPDLKVPKKDYEVVTHESILTGQYLIFTNTVAVPRFQYEPEYSEEFTGSLLIYDRKTKSFKYYCSAVLKETGLHLHFSFLGVYGLDRHIPFEEMYAVPANRLKF